MTMGLNEARRRDLIWWALVVPSAAIPAYMLIFLLRGSRMQFGDYFYMLASVFSPAGRFTPGGLLVHANEHLSAVPKLLYVLNAELFSGSNISLGVAVWLMSAAIFGMLWHHSKPLTATRSAPRALLVWLCIAVAFPLQALHNFVFAMSGAAWILANVFALLALTLAVDGRSASAGVAGSAATFSYGTGLAVWPALVLVLVLRRRRFTWHESLMLLLGAFSVVVERWTREVVYAHPLPSWNPLIVLRSMAVSAGSFFSDSVDVAVVIGTALLVALGYALSTGLRRPMNVGETFAVAVAAYAAGALLMISVSRASFGDETLTGGRYMTLAGLLAFGTAVVALVAWGASRAWRLAVAGGLALALGATAPTIAHFQQVVRDQDLAAIAARIGVAQDGYLRGFEPGSGALLRTLGNYPFSADFGYDCGLLGQDVSDRLTVNRQAVQGTIDNISVSPNPAAINVSGWAYSPVGLKCIVLIDEQGTVIGAAITGTQRLDVRAAQRYSTADVGWVGVAPRHAGSGIRAGATVSNSSRVYLLGDAGTTKVP